MSIAFDVSTQMVRRLVCLSRLALGHAKLMHVALRVFMAVLAGLIGARRSVEYNCCLGLSA